MIKREKGNRLIAEMGSGKDEKSRRLWRGLKTLFFLVTMLISLLLFSAPVLVVIADALLPSAILSTSLPLSFGTLSSHLRNYDFRYSLIDIPLISIARSAAIVCAYYFCDGPILSRRPYLVVTALCSSLSLVFVSFKASYIFDGSSISRGVGEDYQRVMEMALFICSQAMAVGHTVVAYKTSCRERRKMLVYKIDIEAVSPFVSPLRYPLLAHLSLSSSSLAPPKPSSSSTFSASPLQAPLSRGPRRSSELSNLAGIRRSSIGSSPSLICSGTSSPEGQPSWVYFSRFLWVNK